MAQKKVLIPEIGEVTLAKRRGSRHIRLSITAKGVVRVGMPHWTPYAAGIAFARDRADWINTRLPAHQVSDFANGDRIGKAHTLRLSLDKSLPAPTSRISTTEIRISSPYPAGHPETQAKIREAAHRALKKESEKLLPRRLEQLARQHSFSYKEVRIRALTSRWGSCNSHGVITLSYFLIQLPWELIDYVILHELVHTEEMNHGPGFWTKLENLLPGAKTLRKKVNAFKPRAQANNLLLKEEI